MRIQVWKSERANTLEKQGDMLAAQQECEVGSAPGLSFSTFPAPQPGALPTSHSCWITYGCRGQRLEMLCRIEVIPVVGIVWIDRGE